MDKYESIANAINKVDTFYEFSDSNVRWEIEHRQVEKIRTFLTNNKNLISNIKMLLNNIGKVNFERYFSGYS